MCIRDRFGPECPGPVGARRRTRVSATARPPIVRDERALGWVVPPGALRLAILLSLVVQGIEDLARRDRLAADQEQRLGVAIVDERVADPGARRERCQIPFLHPME